MFSKFEPGDYVLRVTYYDAGDIMDNAALARDFLVRQEREALGLPQNGDLFVVARGTSSDATATLEARAFLQTSGAICGWLDQVIGPNECRSLGRI